tara:strand:+ start:381 stop:707 length:327 start_codon:yes stop_codon:yes gene_type:complete
MIYSFRQNNSGGYYNQPAKFVLVKDAHDSEHATEIALAAGVYFNGVANGSDCSCCGDRWHDGDNKFDTITDAMEFIDGPDVLRDSMESDSVPHYIVIDDLDVMDTVLE